MMRLFTKISLLLFCINAYGELFAEQQYEFSTDSPIYVTGDIHGAYNEIETSLKNLGLIDEQNNWSGGTAHFVSLGDLVDRGPASRKVLDLFMRLQPQAEQAGGKFHIVLGNHDIMNLRGDWRYLSTEEINEFAEEETEARRSEAYLKYIQWHQLPDTAASQKEFNDKFPEGFFAHWDGFSPSGKYGQWLLQQPFILKINEELFAHGGISKRLESKSLSRINQQLKSELLDYIRYWNYFMENNQLAFDTGIRERLTYITNVEESPEKETFLNLNKSLTFSIFGPTWYRGTALCHPYFEQDELTKKLRSWDVSRLWVGHTTTPENKIQTRYEGQLIMMDTGTLHSYYKGQPSIARIEKDGKTSYYDGLTGEQTTTVKAANREQANPYNMTDEEVENFLKTAEITSQVETVDGITNPFKVTLEKDGKKMHGIFKYKDSHVMAHKGTWTTSRDMADRYIYELVAYKLDRILGIGLVPVTVERRHNDVPGIIQLWLNGLVSQWDYINKKVPYAGMCDYTDQLNMMDTFDYLIMNRDRNQTNILFSEHDGQIWLIDQSRSFGTSIRRPKMQKTYLIKVTDTFKEKLRELSKEQLEEMSPWLHSKQIRAIWRRRGKLLRNDF